jgi:tetratricopeptide (TPR) repeat protein
LSLLHPICGCENAERKADVVFIHGLGGDAFATWRHGDDETTSWPHWLGQEFPEVGVWSLGYAASPSKWTRWLGWISKRFRDAGHGMALPDRALQVLDLMVLRGLGKRPLFFICHSLGGLVAKQILRTSSDAVEERPRTVFASTRAVLFLATPHAGAALATLADSFRAVFGATVTIQDLRAHDAHLRNLLDWYRNHAVEGIRTVTYFELRNVKGVTIVSPSSAHPGVGADPVGLDEDHLSIAKPQRNAQVCGAAIHLLRNHVLARPPAAAPMPTPAPAAPSPLPPITVHIETAAPGLAGSVPIPQELPPAAEEFFGRQAQLERLTERLRSNKNTAVVGPAGLGKTALAAKALAAVVGDSAVALAASPFPDGVVFLDLYTFHGEAEAAWGTLANKLAGAGFRERSPARERATEACRGRRLLVIIEGGEEANAQDGRADIHEVLSVLSPQNRRLLLTRLNTQAAAAESVELQEALDPEDAASLLDSLTRGRLTAAVRDRALQVLEGHPLALTWAGNLFARDDDDPARLVGDWDAEQLPSLSDPRQAEHTLEWLFNRSIRGLDDTAQQVLAAAALLASAPFPLGAIGAALGDPGQGGEKAARGAIKALVQSGLLRRSAEADHWQFTHALGYRFARKESGSDPAVRERLGRWLHGHLMAALAGGVAGDGPLSLTRALEHLAALLRADEDQRLWNPLATAALYDISDRLNDLGRLGLVKLSLGAVAGWLERFPVDKAQQPYWRRERSVLTNRQGDVLLAQGDLGGALAAYRESLEVSRRLAQADASNAGWQRDLSFSLTRMAEFHEQRGDRAEAMRFAEESLVINERLAALDRTNATWQQDVKVSRALVARLRG